MGTEPRTRQNFPLMRIRGRKRRAAWRAEWRLASQLAGEILQRHIDEALARFHMAQIREQAAKAAAQTAILDQQIGPW